jgi:regulator of replication initiation timing
MITQNKMQQAVDDIKNKICPSEMEEAVVYLFTELTKLQHENTNLKQELKEVYWRIQEHD